MIIVPICLKCEHCKKGMICKVYPDGIPHEILLMQKKREEICKGFKKKNS